MTAITVFFTMFVISAVTVLLVLLVKTVYRKKFTPVFHYYIWALLLIRLMFPILPGSQVSLFNLIPSLDSVIPVYSVQSDGVQPDSTGGGETGSGLAEPSGTASDNPGTGGSVLDKDSITFDISSRSGGNTADTALNIILYSVYAALTLFLLLYTAASYYFRVNRIRRESQPCLDADILGMAQYISRDLGIKKQIPIRIGKNSMVIGIFRPCVILSASNLKDAEMVLIHELTHCRYRDNISGLFFAFLKCFYWFNPLVWYAARRFMVDMEILCDYRVIKRFRLKREEYAMLLFSTVDMTSDSGAPSPVPAMSKAGKQLITRLNYMARQRKFKTGPFARVTAALLVAVMIAICLTNPVAAVLNNDETDFTAIYSVLASKYGTALPGDNDVMTVSGYVNALFLAFADTELPEIPQARLARMINSGAEYFITSTLRDEAARFESERLTGLEPSSDIDLDTAVFILTSFVTLLQNDTLYDASGLSPDILYATESYGGASPVLALAAQGIPFSISSDSFVNKLLGTCSDRTVRDKLSACYDLADGVYTLDLTLPYQTLNEAAGYIGAYTSYSVSDMQNDHASVGFSLLSLCIGYAEPYKIVACGANGADIECSVYFGDYFRRLCFLSGSDEARSYLLKLFISQDPTSEKLSARERQEMINKFGIVNEFYILDQYASGEELSYLKQIISDCASGCTGVALLSASPRTATEDDDISLLVLCGVLDSADAAPSEKVTFSQTCEQLIRLRAALLPY